MTNYEDSYGGEKYIPCEVKRQRRKRQEVVASYGDPYIEQAIADGRYWGENMKREDIIAIFDNEKTKQGTMFRNDPDSLIDVWETNKLLEITVTMTNGLRITMFYGDKTEYIDISSDSYVGFGSTLIHSVEDIESIDVRWRWKKDSPPLLVEKKAKSGDFATKTTNINLN